MSYPEQFKAHLEAFFEAPARERHWDTDFVQRNAPNLRTLEFKPQKSFGFFSYVSCGLAPLLPRIEAKHEFVISSPFATEEHCELMNMIAAATLNRGDFYSWGDVIQIGRPWIYGSEADHLLVSLPYPYGPKLERAETSLPNLSVAWLVPIYETEANFCASAGVEALEQKFGEHSICFWEPQRPKVV